MTGEDVKLDLKWIDHPEELRPLYAEWRTLCERTAAEIFVHPDWFDLWWTHFGKRCRLACLTVRNKGALVGLLPFCIDRIWAGPIPFRIARLAGTDPHCIVFDLPVDPVLGPQVMRAAADHLLGPLRCAAISFTPVTDRAGFLPWLRQLQGQGSILKEYPDGTHVMFDLPDSFDAYLASLSRNRRSQIRGDLKALETGFALESHVGVPDETGFTAFAEFHNRQWQAIGKGGHFKDWPGSAAFYVALARISRPDWGVRIDRQDGRTSDGLSLAAIFSLVTNKTCHARLPARTLDPAADKFSLGKTGLVLAFRALIEAGFRRIEAGRGEYDYKLSLGGQDVQVHRILISRDMWFARFRLRLLLGWADLFNLIYYRVWFLKLGPRLRSVTGGKSRPLWQSWIRTRI